MADKRKSYAKFQCDSCKNITHFVHKSKKDAAAQKTLEMKKYCRHCRKHTLHKEAKK